MHVSLIITYEVKNTSCLNVKLILISLVSSLILPLFILLRQWLGWSYISRRLMAPEIEYEETGWYDGQTWKKPIGWQRKDLLVAQYEVNPILNQIKYSLVLTIFLIISGTFICKAL